jgi:hypothetical protein
MIANEIRGAPKAPPPLLPFPTHPTRENFIGSEQRRENGSHGFITVSREREVFGLMLAYVGRKVEMKNLTVNP